MAKKKQSLLCIKKMRIFLFLLFWGLNPCHQTKEWLSPFEAGLIPFKRGWMAKEKRFQSWLIARNKMGSALVLFSNDTTPKRKRWQRQEVSAHERLLVATSTVLFDSRAKSVSVLQGAPHQSAIDYLRLVCCFESTAPSPGFCNLCKHPPAQMLSKSG